MNQDLKRTFWAAADKLRSNMDAVEYKHVALGLIFLNYILDALDGRRNMLARGRMVINMSAIDQLKEVRDVLLPHLVIGKLPVNTYSTSEALP
jgi:type I restriction-modification system DNA methylase subunit